MTTPLAQPKATVREVSDSDHVPATTATVLFLIAIALSVAAIWSAWDHGGGYRSTKFVASLILMGVFPLGIIAAILVGPRRSRPPAVACIAGLVWLGGLFQCVQMNPDWIGVLSPGSETAASWISDSIRGELTESPSNSGIPISVAPTSTRMALAIPAGFATACWLASLCFASRRVGLVLFVTAAIAGGAFAFFGLADALRLARDSNFELRQRLLITPIGADGPFGPFVNNNNAAGYLNLTLGCALGLLAYVARGTPQAARNSGGRRNLVMSLTHHWRLVACVLLVAIIVAGILGSGSRGGFIGLVCGAIVMTFAGFRTMPKIRMITTLAGIALLAFLTLDGLGIRGQSEDRLRTIYDGKAMKDPRLPHWRDSLTAAIDYMPAGAGFGAYSHAYLPYQKEGGARWFMHADGMPVEWLLEGGVWLTPLVLAGVFVVFRSLRRLHVRERTSGESQNDPLVGMMVTAGTFAIPAMLASQCFDFGILQPPLFLTLGFVCGGIASLELPAQPKTHAAKSNLRILGLTLIGMAVLLTCALSLSTRELYAATLVQMGERLRWTDHEVPGENQSPYSVKLQSIRSLLNRQPDHAPAHLLMAHLLIDRQRQLGVEDLQAQGIGKSDAMRWVVAENVRRAFYGDAINPPKRFKELMLPSQDPRQWRLARQHALTALKLCPLDDATRVLLIELDMVDSDVNRGTPDLIDQTAILRRRNHSVLRHLERLAATFPGSSAVRRVRDVRSAR